MKGMSCDSTPSFARSSEEIGGKSGGSFVSGSRPIRWGIGHLELTLGDGAGGHVKLRVRAEWRQKVNIGGYRV